MLFLPRSVYGGRTRLWKDFQKGKESADKIYQSMLDLDSHDFIGLIGLGRLRLDAGDGAAAEDYFWRAIYAHPCVSAPYLALSGALYQQPESLPLAEALAELGLSKDDGDEQPFAKDIDFAKAGLSGESLEKFRELPGPARRRMVVLSLRANRDGEPPEITARLRALRLIRQIEEEIDLTAETVDAIVAEGAAITPLLIGVMRDWAQNLLEDDDNRIVESALALLGETGSPAEIPYLLEFVDLEATVASGAAGWALGRIIERQNADASVFIKSIAPGLGPGERLAIAEQIVRQPGLDPSGTLLDALSGNLQSMKSRDRDEFLPILLGAIAGVRGRDGVAQGRAILLRNSAFLSRNARRECEAQLASLQREAASPAPPNPSPLTVYDICAGDAHWDEENGETWGEENEFENPPAPIKRKVTPGRNDPCWCNSGKKYKKCHLDSDQLGDRNASAEALLGAPDEFNPLRKRIGEFLGQVLPEKEMKRAFVEYYGDLLPDQRDAATELTDWIVHDWVAPRFQRTIIEEFIARHGSGLTNRARQIVVSWSRSFVGFYEVQELTPGIGFILKDLILGGTLFVHDVNLSTRLALWDGLLTRVVPGERGAELGGVGLTVPRHNIGALRQWMEADRTEAGLQWPEYFKTNWPRIRRESFQIAAGWMDSLRLANTDGEELLISKASYRISDGAAMLAALQGHPELQPAGPEDDPPGVFVWLNQAQTVLGHITAGKIVLELECNSRERLERGKLLLSTIAGTSLRHLRDEFTTQSELKARTASGQGTGVPGQAEIPKEITHAQITRILESHYSTWPDVELPALEGKTPRQVARTPEGRRRLIELLKDMENGEDRKRRAGEPRYDFSRLRAELGLDLK